MKVGYLSVDRTVDAAKLLPQLAEKAGYERFWFTEHQMQLDPLILMGVAASVTEKIRIGAGGFNLTVNDTRRISWNAHLLCQQFPNRIDIGFCRGGFRKGAELPFSESQFSLDDEGYFQKATEFVSRLRRNRPEDSSEGFDVEHAPLPQIWGLGTSLNSAKIASATGASFSYSYFYQTPHTTGPLDSYRMSFAPSDGAEKPYASLAVSGVCLPRKGPKPTVSSELTCNLIGTIEEWREFLAPVVREYRVDELMFCDLADDQMVKAKSLLAFIDVGRGL
jgi:alkanesulfonate monooxygenase SsuD/methylene tetrahydromethanopterin reductase-like flavin-dependent oxidoreductase (luciferase family)